MSHLGDNDDDNDTIPDDFITTREASDKTIRDSTYGTIHKKTTVSRKKARKMSKGILLKLAEARYDNYYSVLTPRSSFILENFSFPFSRDIL